jgi:hypothetical protein
MLLAVLSVGDNWSELSNDPQRAIRHLRFGSDWSNVMGQNTQAFKGIATGQLPAVSWGIPDVTRINP